MHDDEVVAFLLDLQRESLRRHTGQVWLLGRWLLRTLLLALCVAPFIVAAGLSGAAPESGVARGRVVFGVPFSRVFLLLAAWPFAIVFFLRGFLEPLCARCALPLAARLHDDLWRGSLARFAQARELTWEALRIRIEAMQDGRAWMAPFVAALMEEDE